MCGRVIIFDDCKLGEKSANKYSVQYCTEYTRRTTIPPPPIGGGGGRARLLCIDIKGQGVKYLFTWCLYA